MVNDFAFCRDCLADAAPADGACAGCGRRRFARHEELYSLAIAHLDCDAFYAAIEKRDDPTLREVPVIVGGEKRGVVSTACYIARTYGVRSAMPMFKALKACPDAVVVKPNMKKYAAAGREVRRLMESVTPLVEPLSIDEAFMDLTGTERVHGMAPAKTLAKLQGDIEREIGVTVSIGLSHNKFLAKIASDFDKPRGFTVIGRSETRSFLARQPISLIWGVGAKFAERLGKDGLRLIGDLQAMDEAVLVKRYGEIGLRLSRLSRGEDYRKVSTDRDARSVSSETTFNEDIRDVAALEEVLWRLCEKVSQRMKTAGLKGRVVTLKLKDTQFRTITRRETLERPSNLARTAFKIAQPLLIAAAKGRAWRLIGVGYSGLEPVEPAAQSELFETPDARAEIQEKAIDDIRARFGAEAIRTGRTLKAERD